MIILAFFVLWIGVTGRFPALIAAIGLVRGNVPQAPPKSGGITSNSGSVSSTNLIGSVNPNFVGPPDTLHAPILAVWQDAMSKIIAASKANPQEIAVP